MKPITSSTYFEAPPEDVWAVLTDLESAPQRIEAITKLEVLTDGPVGMGTRFRETRIMFKKEATEEMEITDWNPPRSYTTEAESCGCHYTSVISCTPDGSGTRVEFTFEGRPLNFMAKIMSGAMGWMMAGTLRKCLEKDMTDLKQHVEGDRSAVQTA